MERVMNNMPSFHEGELDVQRRAHEDEIATHRIGLIKHVIVGGAVPFIRQQSMAVAGSIDASGRVWASMIFGEPGFLDPSDDAQSLAIHLDRTVRQPNDPLLSNLERQPQIGLMLIELSSRRRLRVNGIAEKTGDTLSVTVRESFPLCPKYIQRRQIQLLSGNDQLAASGLRDGHALGTEQIAQIAAADTFFVATTHSLRGPDVSHRGGRPGFVEVIDATTLRIPDFAGNSMFNTLGNLSINPNAGLVFSDFQAGRLLQLTGTTTILWDQPDPAERSGGTHRFWEFHPEYWRETELGGSIRAVLLEYSPFNP
jgi:uncharacterized protein